MRKVSRTNPCILNSNPERLTVMKKIYVIATVLATALIASCVREQSLPDYTPLGENDIAFVMQGVSTRSGERTAAKKGIILPIGKAANGESLYLEETIEELNPNPTTTGAPAYTQNVGTLYTTMGVYSPTTSFGDAIFDVIDEHPHPDADQYPEDGTTVGPGWRYKHDYGTSPWPTDASSSVDFFLRMPAIGTGVGVSSSSKYQYNDDKTVTFTLNSPEQAADQQDLLFGFTSLTKSEHDSYLPAGAPVTMYHALSGVKFRNGHTNENQTKTIISKVEFNGLIDNGTCVINPATGVVTWSQTPNVDQITENVSFYQDFSNPTYTPSQGSANSDGTIDFTNTSTALQLPNTSWTSAAADHNLNNEEGEFTFWFIPQEMSDDVTLTVTFCVKTPHTPNGTDIAATIKFGELVNANGTVEWKAGQLRTYTLKPFDVDIEIADKMNDPMVKSDLHVANTGNVDEYVRLLIMGNWYGWEPGTTAEQMETTDPKILVGYKYKGDEAALQGLTDEQREAKMKQMVLPWYREGYPCTDTSNPDTCDDTLSPDDYPSIDPYGHFDTSFPLASLKNADGGDRDGKMNDWADASGGFYYTAKIGPGAGTLNINAVTNNLFQSYTLTNIPTIYLPSGGGRAAAVGVHLVMEIVIQAIEVPKKKVTVNGNEVEKDIWWLEAWYEATKVDKLHPNAKKGTDYRNQKYRLHFIAGDYGDVVYDKYPVPEQ